MKMSFNIMLLLICASSVCKAMEDNNQPNANFKIQCKSKYTIDIEFRDNFLEVQEFEEEIDSIKEDIAILLQDLAITYSDLITLSSEEPLISYKITTYIHDGVKRTSNPFKWNFNIIHHFEALNTPEESDRLNNFKQDLINKLRNIQEQLRILEDSMRIMLNEESLFKIEIKIYADTAHDESSSSWSEFFNYVKDIFNMSS